MTAIAVTRLADSRSNRLAAELRGEDGLGLVELLIALLVLNVGIFATLGAFTSAATAINRASNVSAASAISDKTMECFRDSSYANISWAPGAPCYATTTTGPDGRTYNLSATVVPGSQLTTGTYQGSTQVKKVTLTITDPAHQNQVLVTSTSTFSRCTQSGLGTDTTACQS